ncbi:MAG: sulfur carrier protein ThiS [Spirochaetaceae bacterium]
MKIVLNGKEKIINDKTLLSNLIKENSLDLNKIIIQIDDEIIKKEHFSNYSIKPESKIEILAIVGGG